MGEQLVAGVAIIRYGEVLAAQRRYPPELAGRWELPGGKVHAGETTEAACVREVREELGCEITVGGPLGPPAPIGGGLLLQVYAATLTSGVPVPTEHADLRWLGPEQLDEVDWLPADRDLLPDLRDRLLDGDRLPGGNVGGAVRIGDTVRRDTGPWTPAVHDLLRHLSSRGLDRIPSVLGIDARDREIISYLPGAVIDVDTERLSDGQLTSATRWLRRFHDTVRDYRPAGSPRWRFGTAAVGPGQIVCHNDVAAYNMTVHADEVTGVFDWDMASPGDAIDDIGFLAWNCVPLFRDVRPADAARRLRLIASAYGGDHSAADILREAVRRMRAATDRIAAGQRAGDQGMLNLRRVGEPAATRDRITRLQSVLPQIENRLL